MSPLFTRYRAIYFFVSLLGPYIATVSTLLSVAVALRPHDWWLLRPFLHYTTQPQHCLLSLSSSTPTEQVLYIWLLSPYNQ